jgi:hypothetical protein
MSVFSPLVLSQMLVKGATPSVDFGNIFQKSFDSKSPEVISQVQHAIDNLHQPLKPAPPAELSPYQRWHKTAIDEYTLWKNAQKNPTRAPKFEGTLQDVAAVLAKPPEVQFFKNTAKQPGGFLTREEVQERWELEVKGGGGFSTRGDGRRFQCSVSGDPAGIWPFSLLSCLHCFFPPVPSVCITFDRY